MIKLKNKKITYPSDETESFRSLTISYPKKAFQALLMFPDEDQNSIPYWESFFYGVCESKETKTKQEPLKEQEITKEPSNKYFIKALKKIDNFSDTFIDQILDSLVYAWETKSGMIYFYESKSDFKKWWKRLWKLSIQKTASLNKNDSSLIFNTLNSKSGKLVQVIFSILWNHFDGKTIPKNGKIPEDIKKYLNIIITQGAKTNPYIMAHFGKKLFAFWFLDKEWTNQNIKPLMDGNKNKDIFKAIWEGYFYHVIVDLDFLSNFKKELLHMFLNSKCLYEKESDTMHKSNVLESIAELFFIATGGKWYKNIFTDNETKKDNKIKKDNETKKLKQSSILNTDILECLSRQIWVLLKDSKEKSPNLWSENIKPWIDQFWPPQKKVNTDQTAKNLSFAILYCGDKFPEAITFLEEYIKENIKTNHYYILHLINGDINKDEKRLSYIFNYPHELLTLLNWNFPQDDSIYSYYKEELQKILENLKNKNSGIEKDEKYIKIKDKLS